MLGLGHEGKRTGWSRPSSRTRNPPHTKGLSESWGGGARVTLHLQVGPQIAEGGGSLEPTVVTDVETQASKLNLSMVLVQAGDSN